MKEQVKDPRWEEQNEPSKKFVESSVDLDDDGVIDVDDELDEAANDPVSETDETGQPLSAKSKVTELRRRIEQRLEEKRLALEYDYFDLEDGSDSLQ